MCLLYKDKSVRYPNNLADLVLYRLRHVNPNIVRFLPSLQRVRSACVAVCKVSVAIPATAYLKYKTGVLISPTRSYPMMSLPFYKVSARLPRKFPGTRPHGRCYYEDHDQLPGKPSPQSRHYHQGSAASLPFLPLHPIVEDSVTHLSFLPQAVVAGPGAGGWFIAHFVVRASPC